MVSDSLENVRKRDLKSFDVLIFIQFRLIVSIICCYGFSFETNSKKHKHNMTFDEIIQLRQSKKFSAFARDNNMVQQ